MYEDDVTPEQQQMEDEAYLDENGLPVNSIIETLQESEKPELQNLSNEQYYRIENCLRQTVQLQSTPKYAKASVSYHDQVVELYKKDKEGNQQKFEFKIREIDYEDMIELAEHGQQIIYKFLGGDFEKAATMPKKDLAMFIFSKSLQSKVSGSLSDLGKVVQNMLFSLLVDPLTGRLQDLESMKKFRPEYAIHAMTKILECEENFFLYITSMLPESIQGGAAYLNSIILSHTPRSNLLLEELGLIKTK